MCRRCTRGSQGFRRRLVQVPQRVAHNVQRARHKHLRRHIRVVRFCQHISSKGCAESCVRKGLCHTDLCSPAQSPCAKPMSTYSSPRFCSTTCVSACVETVLAAHLHVPAGLLLGAALQPLERVSQRRHRNAASCILSVQLRQRRRLAAIAPRRRCCSPAADGLCAVCLPNTDVSLN